MTAPRWTALLRQAGGRALAGIPRPLRKLSRPTRVREPLLAMPWPAREVRARGEEFYHGLWRLAGREVHAEGRVVFDLVEAPESWQRALHGFDWIFILLAAERKLWTMMARTLVADWFDRARAGSLPKAALHPATAARRMVNLAAAAPTLLATGETAFARRFMGGLNMLARQLLRESTAGLSAADRLEVLMARLWAALALHWPQRQSLLQQLVEDLPRQFLADGGHVSRSPELLLDILATLLPLRTALDAAGMEIPAALAHALEKALPMLRMFRHADNGLVLFQGGRGRRAKLLEQVLAQDAVAGAPLDHAPQSGYARLARGASVLVADVGAPPAPQHFSRGALSALAFEFSSGGARIFTSCGAPVAPHRELDTAARTTAAHCAPVLNDEDAGVLMDTMVSRLLAEAPLAAGPAVSSRVGETAEGVFLHAAHEAWRGRHGLVVARRLFLSADGHDLRGEDIFEPAEDARTAGDGVPFTIRFHLHPAARPSLSRDGRSVLIVLPDRSAWTFGAAGTRLALEESLFMSGEPGVRRTMQIVLRGTCPVEGRRVRWRLRRTDTRRGKPRARGGKRAGTGTNPTLPLQAPSGGR